MTEEEDERSITQNQITNIQGVSVGRGAVHDATFASVLKAMDLPEDVPIKFLACRLQDGRDFTSSGTFVPAHQQSNEESEVENLKEITSWLSQMFFTVAAQVLQKIHIS